MRARARRRRAPELGAQANHRSPWPRTKRRAAGPGSGVGQDAPQGGEAPGAGFATISGVLGSQPPQGPHRHRRPGAGRRQAVEARGLEPSRFGRGWDAPVRRTGSRRRPRPRWGPRRGPRNRPLRSLRQARGDPRGGQGTEAQVQAVGPRQARQVGPIVDPQPAAVHAVQAGPQGLGQGEEVTLVQAGLAQEHPPQAGPQGGLHARGEGGRPLAPQVPGAQGQDRGRERGHGASVSSTR